MSIYPENDYRDYLSHSWDNHKYVAIRNGRYIYPDDLKSNSSSSAGPNVIYAPGVKRSSATNSGSSIKAKDKIAVVGSGGKDLGRYSTSRSALKAGRLGKKVDEDEDDDSSSASKSETIRARLNQRLRDSLNKVVTSKATKKTKTKSSSKKSKKSTKSSSTSSSSPIRRFTKAERKTV